MAKENIQAKIGVWAFVIGCILALVSGFVTSALIVAALVIVGILVGFLNVTKDESKDFIMYAAGIMIALFTAGSALAGSMVTLGVAGKYMWTVMMSLNVLIFPAVIVVAVKNIFALAKD